MTSFERTGLEPGFVFVESRHDLPAWPKPAANLGQRGRTFHSLASAPRPKSCNFTADHLSAGHEFLVRDVLLYFRHRRWNRRLKFLAAAPIAIQGRFRNTSDSLVQIRETHHVRYRDSPCRAALAGAGPKRTGFRPRSSLRPARAGPAIRKSPVRCSRPMLPCSRTSSTSPLSVQGPISLRAILPLFREASTFQSELREDRFRQGATSWFRLLGRLSADTSYPHRKRTPGV